jgi:hypothetical protein
MQDRYLAYTRTLADSTATATVKARAIKIAGPCRQCGREFWSGKRSGRRREFCSNACRQASFRNADFGRRYRALDPLRNTEKTAATSIAYQGEKQGRAFPLDLLGHGRRWPGPSLDPELRRKIIRAELGLPST